MALEFALRPRIDLERPAPRRRRVRIPRFALLMAAYWVGTAGATVVLLRVVRDEPEPALSAEPAEEPAIETTAPPDEPLAANTQPAPPEPATLAPVAPPEPATLAPVAPPEPPVASTAEPSREPRAPDLSVRPEVRAPGPRVHVEPRSPEPRVRVEPRSPEPPPLVAAREEPARAEPPPTSLPSCEAAAASADETLDLRGAPAAPDLPREAFAAVLDDGAYLAACAPPERTALEICAAVQDGRVVGVSASSEPRNPVLNACVRRAVAALRFPKSARLDVTRTRFSAAR